jgi:hypothetical protein
MLNQSPLYRREGNFTGASLIEDFPVTPEDALIIDSLARFHPSMPELPQAANGIPLEAASREPIALSCRRRKAASPKRTVFYFIAYLQPWNPC